MTKFHMPKLKLRIGNFQRCKRKIDKKRPENSILENSHGKRREQQIDEGLSQILITEKIFSNNSVLTVTTLR